MNKQKIAKGIGACITLQKFKVIKLLNKHNANLKYATPKSKVYKTVKSFVKSNQKFTKDFIQFLIDNKYCVASDFETKGKLEGDNFNSYSKFIGGNLLAQGVGAVQDFLKQDEVDSEVLNTILEIEQQKSESENKNLAKYWVVGGLVVGLITITGIIIYKKS
tara:strand:- start:411 stop:896 length:486 start_codon:yes stop_codon:yes gene_type:complete